MTNLLSSPKKGSILIYTLLLTSFLALFFVSFQWELEKLLETTKWREQSAKDISRLKDALVILKDSPTESTTLTSDEYFSLVSLDQNRTAFTRSVNDSHSDEYWITASGWSNSVTLSILEWWPVFYRLAAFQSGSEAMASIFASGITTTTTNNSISLSGVADQHVLIIEWLGWYTQYTLDIGTTTTLPSSSSYIWERRINGYKKNEWTYDMTHFVPMTRTGILYQNLGMYLKK